MKIKDKKTFSAKTASELKTLLIEKRDELFLLKQELIQKKLKNTRSVFWKKKEIAIILTLLKEKELFKNAKNI
ncbi:MAG: 50S ribosomal protein L29 [Candidatus Levybacteria bacterium]|nr:50S ribosomal protein L29 [Candidatus Levybacteria bacterium]